MRLTGRDLPAYRRCLPLSMLQLGLPGLEPCLPKAQTFRPKLSVAIIIFLNDRSKQRGD
jgi:hypothetical protein